MKMQEIKLMELELEKKLNNQDESSEKSEKSVQKEKPKVDQNDENESIISP